MHIGLGLTLGVAVTMGGGVVVPPRRADTTTLRADTTTIKADRA
jgi:hypothetical protein